MHQFGSLVVHQFACLSDNYGFLLRDEPTGKVATVDTPDGARIAEEAERLGWRIDTILNTHWHQDHIGGNKELKARYGAEIIAPAGEGDRIPEKDRAVAGGDTVWLGETLLEVLDVPGHTLGHIAYHAPQARVAFVGDALFSLGCGRMFEGEPQMFWNSLKTLRGLPGETTIFCAHEYTAANAAFALSVEPDNADLQARVAEVTALREAGRPTVPVTLAGEWSTNPFLRSDMPAMAAQLGMEGHPAHEVFAELRRQKDQF